ncbi:type II CAAX endopeptidase family protein [Curtobacterium sp. MCLR17_032]|uniref:CPBP family intramembrane glutamic endopeptidase n=1 Tax=unclassified Curtobacterium TaxID=257496 RepID=UPI000DA76296|nr:MULTISPECIES: type II CAAX endopeptidase family protein [unclassified Curtobacterium]MDN3478914.1 type II CAAX endopeptidase family protein [Curtobacterium sp. APC 4022]WIE62080.1 type II CAAX endopeptidase family protein [Curtobacterium sp. MCLR17_032]
MSTESDVTHAEPDTSRQRDLVILLVALGVAVILARVASGFNTAGKIQPPVMQVLVADFAVWLPLVAGIVWVLRRSASTDRAARLRLGLGDAIFAIGIVILCRVFDVFLGLAFTGSTGLTPAPTLGTPDETLLIVSAIGIVLVSPFLEEVFFRGLFQRRMAAELTPRTRFLAVFLTAFLFAVLHVLLGAGGTQLEGFRVFLTIFVLGSLTGTLVAMTNRIGGAIMAHVLFNAVAVVATWPR